MEQKAYDRLKRVEDSWWWKGRSYVVSRLLLRYMRGSTNKILDVGAGYGSMFSVLSPYGPLTALEIYEEAARACKSRGYAEVFTRDSDLESRVEYFDLVGAFDVVEHMEDDTKFAQRLCRVLKKGGLLVATVPAFQSLWSAHDIEHHHFRRYSRRTLQALLTSAGFEVLYVSYWNCTLFPVAFVLRMINRGGGENLTPLKIISSLLSLLLWLESRCMPLLFLPWGISLVIIARRKE